MTVVPFRRALLLGLLALAGSGVAASPAPAALSGSPTVFAEGLDTPWEVVLVPDGRVLVTERPGRIRVILPDGSLRATPVYSDPTANKFLGLELHPDYAANKLVYLYVSYGPSGGNRVIRLRDDGTNLLDPQPIFTENIRSDGNHDGGRIKFGPDGKLYVTTGDVHDPSTPQNLDSLNGKILRLDAPGGPGDGAAPADNPFNASGEARPRRFVWSYGHRHPQGIAWDASGCMWESEHGPSGESYAGGRGSRDEINRIDRGQNYGWPIVMGAETREGMRPPALYSGDSTTWAPGGAAVGPDGRLYVPTLAGRHLRDVGIANGAVTDHRALFSGTYGRLRTATVGRGQLWLTTHNGSGDKVLRLPFAASSPPPAGTCPTAPPPVFPPEPVPVAPGLPAPAAEPEAPAQEEPPLAAATPHVAAAPALDRLLTRTSTALRRIRLSGMLRRGRLIVRAEGLLPGRVTLRVEHRPGRGRRLLAATGTGRVTGAGAASVRLKPTARGRRALSRVRRARLVLRAEHRGADGARTARSLTLRVRR
ncbi:MAG: PQQ-dependent sugar dehydrogenase [Thermoleophilaceae bacterium]